jgi:predicted nucleotidyltransferase
MVYARGLPMQKLTVRNLDLPEKQIAGFFRRWRISEFALFGSVLRDDFDPDADWSLLDHIRMEQELSTLLGRRVDLLSRQSVERSHNWIRRQEILDTAKVVYASR